MYYYLIIGLILFYLVDVLFCAKLAKKINKEIAMGYLQLSVAYACLLVSLVWIDFVLSIAQISILNKIIVGFVGCITISYLIYVPITVAYLDLIFLCFPSMRPDDDDDF